MSITSLILGITSFLLCLIPVVGIVAIIPIFFSILFGIISLVKMHKNPENKQSKAPSVAGISLSLVGLVIMIAWTIVVYTVVSYVYNYKDDFTNMLNEDTVIESINGESESR